MRRKGKRRRKRASERESLLFFLTINISVYYICITCMNLHLLPQFLFLCLPPFKLSHTCIQYIAVIFTLSSPLLGFILCTLMFCLYVCLYEGARSSGTVSTGSCRLPCGCWDVNPDPLRSQCLRSLNAPDH